jgi:hypothetical protein
MISILPGAAHAAPSVPVKISNLSLGGIVAEIGGAWIAVVVDPSLPATHIQIGEKPAVDIAQNILLKGDGAARARYLDDARNSAPVGTAVKQALKNAIPQASADIESQHRNWAKSFARRVLAWNKAIASKLANRTFRPSAYTYLLEWAGAKIAANGETPPPSLSRVPSQPTAPTLAAYESYVDTVVSSLASP